MKSEWKVTSNFVGGEKCYGVYRLRDIGAVDHSGNREHASCGLLESRDDAAYIAEQMNLHKKDKEEKQ